MAKQKIHLFAMGRIILKIMNDIFYFYGIIYILHHIKTVYDVLKFDYKKDVRDKIDELIPDKVTGENVVAFKKARIETLKKSALEMFAIAIAGILNFVWIVVGALYAVESNSFFVLFIISVLSSLIILIYAVTIMLKNKNKILHATTESHKSGIISMTDTVQGETPNKVIWNVIDSLVRIGIAVFILYQHFMAV